MFVIIMIQMELNLNTGVYLKLMYGFNNTAINQNITK